MSHGRPRALVTKRCAVEKWEADSGAVLDARTCVPALAFMFSLLFSLVSDNCHGTEQRATSRRSLVAFTEEQVCGKIFLRNFTFACRKCRRCGSSRLRRWGGQRNGRARKLWQFDAAHPTYYGFLKETGGQNSPAWLLSASGLAAGLCPSGTPHRLGKGTDRDRP